MQYRWEAATPDGFVRQVVQYVSSGHFFYFADQVGEHVDLGALDRKLLEEYGCELQPWTRSRRKAAGIASVHYLRHERFFVLVATAGRGPFFDALGEERSRFGQVRRPRVFKDVRRESLVYGDYSIRYTLCQNSRVQDGARVRLPKHHTLVRLNKQVHEALKAYMLDRATRWQCRRLEDEFWSLGFYPFRPVIDQLMSIVRAVNKRRRTQGMSELDHRRCVRRRRPVAPVYAEHRQRNTATSFVCADAPSALRSVQSH